MKNRIKFYVNFFLFFFIIINDAYSEENIKNLNASSPISDSLELVNFFNALDGANWTNSWDLNTPVSTWYGILLNGNGCVEGINLADNNLAGVLTDLNLPALEGIILSTNNITGEIPDFSYLGNLKFLVLSENSFNSTIPNFSNLPLLEILQLSECGLSGEIPNFSGLENMWQLIAVGNNLEGVIPDFSNLPNLSYLQLSNNSLSGEVPNFSNIPELLLLLLYDNNLSGSIPDFDNLNLLLTVGLSGNQLSGVIPDFSELPNLKVLNLAENQIAGEVPNFFNLPNLTRLDLSYNQLSGAIPDFSNLSTLDKLHLTGNNLSTILPDFTNFPVLSTLLIDDNQFDTLPVFTNISATIYPANNSLTFDDLLPNISLNNVDTYSPQDSIHEIQIIVILEGEDLEIDLGIDNLITTNSYQWYKNNNLYNSPSNQNKLFFNNIQLNDAGIYTCSVKNVNAFLLTLNSRPITIIVEENPLNLLVNFIDVNICPDTKEAVIDIEVSGGIPPYNYIWSNNDTTEDLEGIYNGQYIVTVTDSNNKVLIDTFLLHSNIVFPDANAGEDDLSCGDSSVLLSAENMDTLNGEWSAISSPVIIESPNNSLTSAYGLLPGNNLFIWTLNTNECPNYDKDTVIINYMPRPTTNDDIYEIYLDSFSFEFNVLKNDLYVFSKNKWTIESINAPPSLNYIDDGIFVYQIIGDEEDNSFQYKLCSSICAELCDTATIVFSFVQEEMIPNAITVNEDGINDTFQFPESIYNSKENAGITIFNRWGNIVYKAKPYLNDWDGTSLQGEQLPAGTYYYRFILDVVNEKIYFGDITILR